MIKIGEINYANVVPIFANLRDIEGVDFVKGVPSYLNKAIRENAIDIAPCSSIEYARCYKNYLISPGISISSIGKVKSVNFFSKFSLEELGNKNIYLTSESSTSVVLFKILLKYYWEKNVNFVNEIGESDGEVLIGDKALFSYYNRHYPYMYDLGEEWYKFTSLPFVFALWIIRRDLKFSSEIKYFLNKLNAVKSDSKKNLASLIDNYSFKGLTSFQIIDYWETINYDLTDKHISGLMKYYSYSMDMGEIDYLPPLDFFYL